MELLIASVVVLIGFSAYQRYTIYQKNKKLTLLSVALYDKYSETAFDGLDATKEEFLKFVSQSREWAFEYIESLQGALKEFYDSVGPAIDHYENYGRFVTSQHSAQMDQLSLACQKLKEFLPQEEVTK